MRISTSSFFDSAINRIGDLQSGLARTQQQIATGRRVLTPSDDPIAASDTLKIKQAEAANDQLAVNRQTVKSRLGEEEVVLQSVTTLLQDVKTLLVSAGNGALDDNQRRFYAAELRGQIDQMLGYANSRDGTGNYMFAGFRSETQPFSPTTTGATYAGDQGQRLLQIGATRQVALSDPGSTVFEGNRTGNGVFVTAANTNNTGTGIISTGAQVANIAPTTSRYELVFTSATTYDVMDTTITPATVFAAAQTFTSGAAITVDGRQFEITGTPATGDRFTLEPSTNQSIFTTLTNLYNLLTTTTSNNPSGLTRLTNGLNTAQNNIDQALDNVLTVRASVGVRLKEIDSLDNEGEDRKLQYAQALVTLQDLDYTKAISDLTKRQITLDAAQKSFIQVSGLSLFNYIS